MDAQSGSAKSIFFHVRRLEKGDKVTTTTEVLLELPFNEHLTSIMDDMKQDEPVKDMLRNVISDEFRVSFKTHYWGEVCHWTAFNHYMFTSTVISNYQLS